MDLKNRIVVLIDMDCFYCQVEEKLNPELEGKPIAVVQYNPWKGGGIIAVNYVARAMGVTRHMRGDEAKEKCPEIQLPSVPCLRGKADITKYRDAGKDVAKVLQKFTPLLERASIDEAYLDITDPVQKRLKMLNIHNLTSDMMPNTFALGYDSIDQFISDIHNCASDSIDFDYEHAKQLLVGALIVSEIRAAVYEETGYRCSAGIGHNKILAKLVCGMNKPNKQTVLPKHSVNILYKTLSVKKVKHLGGKFGDQVCNILKIKTMAELQQFTEKDLQARFDEKNGTWLYNIARGIDLEPVQARFNPKSIGCCKQFRGKSALVELESLKKWLKDLGDEIEDRLEKDALENNRTPKQMVVSFSLQLQDGRDSSSSRSYNFAPDDELCGELFTSKAFEILMESAEGYKPKEDEENRKLKAPIKFLGISVGKFEDHSECKKTKKINEYFAAGSKGVVKFNENKLINENNNKNEGKEYIFRKFFQTSNNKQNGKTNELVEISKNDDVIESSLDKQESFFAKYLNHGIKKSETNQISSVTKINEVVPSTSKEIKQSNDSDNSNDTVYSGSTINDEINKSIALFEEDPDEVARVSHLREMLRSTDEHTNKLDVKSEETSEIEIENENCAADILIEKIECSECGKIIPLQSFDEHADYHLALKLRDEERQEIRKERDKPKEPIKEIKKRTESKPDAKPISNFFKKFDDTVPTKICIECGKKVHLEKYPEHLDFHEAQKLSRELNNRSVIANCSSTVKRKRKSASPVKKTKVPCKSIDLFFR